MPLRNRILTSLGLLLVLALSLSCNPNPQPEALTPIPTLAPAATLTLVTELQEPPVAGGETAPTASAVETPPPVPAAGDATNGATIFAANCAVCHGDMGEGRIGATLAKSWAGVRVDLGIRNSIANGVPNAAMPAWSQANGGPLSEDEINDLVSYILSWDNPNAQAQPTVGVDEPTQSPWLRGARMQLGKPGSIRAIAPCFISPPA